MHTVEDFKSKRCAIILRSLSDINKFIDFCREENIVHYDHLATPTQGNFHDNKTYYHECGCDPGYANVYIEPRPYYTGEHYNMVYIDDFLHDNYLVQQDINVSGVVLDKLMEF